MFYFNHTAYISNAVEMNQLIDNGEKDMRKMTRLINYNRVF